jgi:hypothetical protein
MSRAKSNKSTTSRALDAKPGATRKELMLFLYQNIDDEIVAVHSLLVP